MRRKQFFYVILYNIQIFYKHITSYEEALFRSPFSIKKSSSDLIWLCKNVVVYISPVPLVQIFKYKMVVFRSKNSSH